MVCCVSTFKPLRHPHTPFQGHASASVFGARFFVGSLVCCCGALVLVRVSGSPELGRIL